MVKGFILQAFRELNKDAHERLKVKVYKRVRESIQRIGGIVELKVDDDEYERIFKGIKRWVVVEEEVEDRIEIVGNGRKTVMEVVYKEKIDGRWIVGVRGGIERERAERSVKLLEKRLKEGKKYREKYGWLMELAERYYRDAVYYLEMGDYFTSFGASDYAYGILDALRDVEGS